MTSEARPQPQLNSRQCIEELNWNVEELAFVRLLGERFELAAMYPEPPQEIIRSLLQPLRCAIRATSLAFVASPAVEPGRPVVHEAPWPACSWNGPQVLDDEQCLRLATGRGQRVIDNQVQPAAGDSQFVQAARALPIPQGVASLIVIGVGNFHCWVGHFLALNSTHADGFGTREASLLRTVAALLTMYAMNYRESSSPFEIAAP